MGWSVALILLLLSLLYTTSEAQTKKYVTADSSAPRDNIACTELSPCRFDVALLMLNEGDILHNTKLAIFTGN